MCLSPSSRRDLERIARPMQRSAALLISAGVSVPDKYVELLPGYRPTGAVGLILADPGPDPLQSAGINLTTPAPCEAWFDDSGPPSERAGEAQYVLQQWMIERSGKHVTMDGKQAQAWIDDAGSPAALAWVRRTFAQLRACDLDAIQLPYPDETS